MSTTKSGIAFNWDLRKNYELESSTIFAPCLNLIFYADKFHSETQKPRRYATTYWIVDPKKSKNHFISAIFKFYETLRIGEAGISEVERPMSIEFSKQGEKYKIPVNDEAIKQLSLEKILSRINIPLRLLPFQWLRINTPYADFGFVTTKTDKAEWNPKKSCCLTAESSQDVSEPLSRLIHETSPYSLDALPQEMLPALKRVYEF